MSKLIVILLFLLFLKKGMILYMIRLPQIKATGTLSERTYDIIKSAIIGLYLEPGELITVGDISEQLGISRTPIRTALNRLIEEDLVEIIPGKGTFVTCLTEKQANAILDVRELFECYSIQLATELRTDEDLDNLEYMLKKQELASKGERKNQQDFLTNDLEFHSAIAKISKNGYLEKQLLQMHVNSMRYLIASTVENIISLALEEHRELYEQIKNRDSEKAKQCMQKHLWNIKERIIMCLNIND